MNHKYILTYNQQTKKIDSIRKAFYSHVPEGDISILKLLWFIFFEKGFRWKLVQTIKYALQHSNSYRGDKSSTVFLFTLTKGYNKIWNKNKY